MIPYADWSHHETRRIDTPHFLHKDARSRDAQARERQPKPHSDHSERPRQRRLLDTASYQEMVDAIGLLKLVAQAEREIDEGKTVTHDEAIAGAMKSIHNQ